jgi:hypothetical protein
MQGDLNNVLLNNKKDGNAKFLICKKHVELAFNKLRWEISSEPLSWIWWSSG